MLCQNDLATNGKWCNAGFTLRACFTPKKPILAVNQPHRPRRTKGEKVGKFADVRGRSSGRQVAPHCDLATTIQPRPATCGRPKEQASARSFFGARFFRPLWSAMSKRRHIRFRSE